jgi:hypothetical protein
MAQNWSGRICFWRPAKRDPLGCPGPLASSARHSHLPRRPSGSGKIEYGSAAKNLGFKRWRPDHGIATDKYEKDLERWEKLLKEITRKGG